MRVLLQDAIQVEDEVQVEFSWLGKPGAGASAVSPIAPSWELAPVPQEEAVALDSDEELQETEEFKRAQQVSSKA